MSEPTKLLIPAAGPFYDRFAMPGAWVLLRLCVGGLLMVEGWGKIAAPMAMTGFVESIGFWPGWFWSPLLAVLLVAAAGGGPLSVDRSLLKREF